jgi:hypothetical protein
MSIRVYAANMGFLDTQLFNGFLKDRSNLKSEDIVKLHHYLIECPNLLPYLKCDFVLYIYIIGMKDHELQKPLLSMSILKEVVLLVFLLKLFPVGQPSEKLFLQVSCCYLDW